MTAIVLHDEQTDQQPTSGEGKRQGQKVGNLEAPTGQREGTQEQTHGDGKLGKAAPQTGVAVIPAMRGKLLAKHFQLFQ